MSLAEMLYIYRKCIVNVLRNILLKKTSLFSLSSLFALTWPNFVLLLPFLIFGVAEEPGGGPGEMVIGQSGVFLSDKQRPEETFGCLLIILNGDLESSWKTLAVYISPQIKTNLVLKSPFKNYNNLKQRSACVFTSCTFSMNIKEVEAPHVVAAWVTDQEIKF